MERIKTGKSASLVNICKAAFLLISFVAIVFTALILYEANGMADRYVGNTGEYTLELYANTLDSQLENIYEYSINFLKDNADAAILDSATEIEEEFQAKKAISEELEEFLSLHPVMGGVLFYREDKSVVRINDTNTTFDVSNQIRAYLLELIDEVEEEQGFNTGWEWHEYDTGAFCLLSVVRYQDSYCAAWINGRALKTMLGAEKNRNGQGTRVFFRQDGQEYGFDGNTTNGNVMTLSRSSAAGDFEIWLEIERYDKTIRKSIAVVVMACILLIICLVLLFRWLSGVIRDMVGKLNGGLHMIGQDITARIPVGTNIQEVDGVFTSLNHMAEQVETLQLKVYQSRIEEQKSHIRFLQTQIKSHYYINCLNIIYSLAEIEKYELIQQFALNLVDYYRYMGNAFGQMMTLKEELKHIKNYIHIQQMRYPDRICYEEVVEQKVENARFLPLVLLTFVENIFKHALNMKEKTEVVLLAEAVCKDEKQGIRIILRDNGPGFAKEKLEEFRWFLTHYPDTEAYGGRESGIINTITRLYMQYGADVEIGIQNRTDGPGAQITLFMRREEGERIV